MNIRRLTTSSIYRNMLQQFQTDDGFMETLGTSTDQMLVSRPRRSTSTAIWLCSEKKRKYIKIPSFPPSEGIAKKHCTFGEEIIFQLLIKFKCTSNFLISTEPRQNLTWVFHPFSFMFSAKPRNKQEGTKANDCIDILQIYLNSLNCNWVSLIFTNN